MNIKNYLVILIILLSIQTTFSWGDKGHILISKKAVQNLPEEMNGFKLWAEYIAEHSVDPDKRKKDDPAEFPKHFIDIDYYKEFLNGNMVYEKNELIKLYNDSIVTEMGTLPWTTAETLNHLTKAFSEKNRDRILIYASDLAHYVGDGHQPMHIVLNYDGQLSGQKGIHGRYEIEMIHKNLEKIDNSIDSCKVTYIETPEDFIFGYLFNSNGLAPVLFEADQFAFNAAGSREGEDYYRLLWFRTNYVTTIQFNLAVKNLSSLIYTAWVNAGEPSFNEIN